MVGNMYPTRPSWIVLSALCLCLEVSSFTLMISRFLRYFGVVCLWQEKGPYQFVLMQDTCDKPLYTHICHICFNKWNRCEQVSKWCFIMTTLTVTDCDNIHPYPVGVRLHELLGAWDGAPCRFRILGWALISSPSVMAGATLNLRPKTHVKSTSASGRYEDWTNCNRVSKVSWPWANTWSISQMPGEPSRAKKHRSDKKCREKTWDKLNLLRQVESVETSWDKLRHFLNLFSPQCFLHYMAPWP